MFSRLQGLLSRSVFFSFLFLIIHGRDRSYLSPPPTLFCMDILILHGTQVMTGKDPFHYISSDVEVVHSVLRGVLPRRAPVFGESDGLWQFLERCWVEDPVRRPSMALALLRMEEIYCLYSETDKEEGPSTPRSSGH